MSKYTNPEDVRLNRMVALKKEVREARERLEGFYSKLNIIENIVDMVLDDLKDDERKAK